VGDICVRGAMLSRREVAEAVLKGGDLGVEQLLFTREGLVLGTQRVQLGLCVARRVDLLAPLDIVLGLFSMIPMPSSTFVMS
jgi:hypothetical protein